MRVFTATLGAETNSFSPIPTGWEAFASAMLWRPGEHPEAATEATGPLVAARERKAEGWTIIEGTCAFAWPGGPVRRDVYERLRDEIVAQAAKAAPLDIIALGVHGAMIADGYDDCEADLFERLRAVAPDAAIGAVFDLHAHLSPRMADAADLLIGFKLYPHTDYLERARELIKWLALIKDGAVKPESVLLDCGMLIGFRTNVAPFRALVKRLERIEARPGVISASINQGFGLGDCADMGTKVLVVADADRNAARAAAEEIKAHLLSVRERARGAARDLDRILTSAQRSKRRPVILADTSDNPGGGAPGDNTALIVALRERDMIPCAIGPVWDPLAVRFCFEAGIGARLNLRIGGKAGAISGAPLDLDGEVIGLKQNATQPVGDFNAPLGDIAGFQADGVSIVLSSLRDQAYDPSLFTQAGVDPMAQHYLVVKSSQQFRIGFETLGGRIMAAPRPQEARVYKKRPRPLWPFEQSPAPAKAKKAPRPSRRASA
jgi:microcystin degradation protein MlrC